MWPYDVHAFVKVLTQLPPVACLISEINHLYALSGQQTGCDGLCDRLSSQHALAQEMPMRRRSTFPRRMPAKRLHSCASKHVLLANCNQHHPEGTAQKVDDTLLTATASTLTNDLTVSDDIAHDLNDERKIIARSHTIEQSSFSVPLPSISCCFIGTLGPYSRCAMILFGRHGCSELVHSGQKNTKSCTGTFPHQHQQQ